MSPSKPPTNEIGNSFFGVGTWNSLYDANEFVPQLAWPNSVQTYGRMRRDAQIASLEKATQLPILARRWRLDPNGADERIVQFVADDLGIPILDGPDDVPKRRSRGRFRLRNHLREALTYRAYGHSFFEQVVEKGSDGFFHLKKLAPRWQSSIQEIRPSANGGLDYIKQWTGTANMAGLYIASTVSKPIPVERLVAYVNDQEGNWFGNSVLHPIYKHWICKDLLLKIDTVKHERNGMGVPIIEAPLNASKAQLIEAARLTAAYRAGEEAGGVLPNGFKLRLVGVEGSIPDTIASLKYHDEQMARVYLAMFMQLGQTQTGSRALSESFTDFFGLSLDAICEDIISVFNEHVIEDLVDWNFGTDAGAPLLCYDDTDDKSLDVAGLVSLIGAGALTMDNETEDWIRSDFDIPDRTTDRTVTGPTKPDPNAQKPATDKAPANLATGGLVSTGGFALIGESGPEIIYNSQPATVSAPPQNKAGDEHRTPNEHELAAKTDFAAMEQAFNDAVNYLVAQWNTQVKPAQIESLAAQVAQANADLVALTQIAAPVLGDGILSSEIARTVSQSSAQAVLEAAAQGVTIEAPAPETFADLVNQRSTAIATVMANSLTESASRHAVTHLSPTTTSEDLSQSVRDHLASLTDASLKKNFGALVHGMQFESRVTTLDQADVASWYSSELVDTPRICDPCIEINDTPYATLEEARNDYPLGFYKLCAGDIQCRGALIAILKNEQPPTTNDVPGEQAA